MRGRRLLVIEDDAILRGFLDRLFSASGLEVLGAPTGQVGLVTARSARPHAVLCDFHLPDMTGLAVLEALRASQDTCEIPVTVTSADVGLPSACQERVRELGARLLLGVTTSIEFHKVVADMLSTSLPSPGRVVD